MWIDWHGKTHRCKKVRINKDLPCPFCYGFLSVFNGQDLGVNIEFGNYHFIKCLNCSLTVKLYFRNSEDVYNVADWQNNKLKNKYAEGYEDGLIKGQRDALREVLGDISAQYNLFISENNIENKK